MDYGDEYEWKDGERGESPDTPIFSSEVLREASLHSNAASLAELGELEEDSMVLYNAADTTDWRLGRLVGVDAEERLVEVQRYDSYSRRRGRVLKECEFRPAYLDPRDGNMIFIDRPLARYEPILDVVAAEDILQAGFYLTNRGKLHQAQTRSLPA